MNWNWDCDHPAVGGEKLLLDHGATNILRSLSHPDVEKFKPTALKLAKQYVYQLPIQTCLKLTYRRRIRHRGPDWSK